MIKKLLIFALLLIPGTSSAAVCPVVFGCTGSSTMTGILIGNGTSALRTLTIGSNLSLTGTTLSASGGGAGTWGTIGGTLSSQTDLQSALDAKLSLASWYGTTTSQLTEGSNLYYTLLRFASALAGTTTDALREGSSNLYFTNGRAQSALAGFFATTTASNTWGGTQAFTNVANFNGLTNNGGATTTSLYVNDYLIALASSTIQNFNSASSTVGTQLVTNSTTTNFFASFASTTRLTGASATLGTLNLGTVLSVSNGGSGASTLTGLLKGNGASAFTIGANGTDFTLISGTTCGGTDKVSAISASGAVTCTADQTGAASGAPFPFTTLGTIGVSTSTIVSFTGGMMAMSSSTIQSLFSTQATTTQLNIGSQFTVTGISTSTILGAIKAGCFTVDGTTCLSAGGSGSSVGGTGAVQFANGAAFNGNSNFFWDNTNNRLGIGTSTPISTLHVNGRVTAQPQYDCPLPVSSITPVVADILGTAALGPQICNGNMGFDMLGTTDGRIPAMSATVGERVFASGTPPIQILDAAYTAGNVGNEGVVFKGGVYAGSATSSGGVAMDTWLMTPLMGTPTTTVTFFAGFSNAAFISLTTTAAYIATTEGCWIAASSTANWKAYCRRAGVQTQADTGFATSTAPFKVLQTLDQTGYKVYFNNNPTAAATIAPANIPTAYLRPVIGALTTAGLTPASGVGIFGVGPITVWSSNF